MAIGTLGAVLAVAITPAFAETSTLVLTGATAPRGGVVVTAANGTNHYLSPDHINGLCQVNLATATAPASMGPCVDAGTKVTQLALDTAPVDKTTGLRVTDPATGHPLQFIYTGDLAAHAGEGVLRYAYDPLGNGGAGALAPFHQSIAANCGIEGNLPWGAALGPDGNLYLSFKKTPNIVRVTNPAGNPTCQNVSTIGNSADGRKAFALAFDGPNLWEADTKGLGEIPNAPACVSGCNAQGLLTNTIVNPTAIASDQINHALYVGNANTIYKVSGLQSPFFISAAPYAPNFSFVSGLYVDPTTNALGTQPVVWAADDPSNGLTPGAGRIWRLLP